MKHFYIETDRLLSITKVFRFVYNEKDDGTISFVKVIDPTTNEEITVDEMKKKTSPDVLLNISTAYHANYKRFYF